MERPVPRRAQPETIYEPFSDLDRKIDHHPAPTEKQHGDSAEHRGRVSLLELFAPLAASVVSRASPRSGGDGSPRPSGDGGEGESMVMVVSGSRSSSLSSFDLSTLTGPDSKGLDSRVARKAEAYERARELALSLSEEEGMEMERERNRIAIAFAVVSIALTFINFAALRFVPLDVQLATFDGSLLSAALKSQTWRCSIFFLIGACCPMWLELFVSAVLFYSAGEQLVDKEGKKRKAFILWGVTLFSGGVLTIVLLPYVFMVNWPKNAMTPHESYYVAINFWQYAAIESIAVTYAIRHMGLTRTHYLDAVTWRRFFVLLGSAWAINLSARITETFSMLQDSRTGLAVATALHVTAGVGYLAFAAFYAKLFLKGRNLSWRHPRMSLNDKYSFMTVLAIDIIIVIYMGIKYMLLSQHSSDTLVDLSEGGLATKTYILVIVTIPTGYFMPARMLQINHIIATRSLTALRKGLVDEGEGKEEEREKREQEQDEGELLDV